MTEITATDVERVLADPKQAQRVVLAAARATNALINGTPDGDNRERVARNLLSECWVDYEAIIANLNPPTYVKFTRTTHANEPNVKVTIYGRKREDGTVEELFAGCMWGLSFNCKGTVHTLTTDEAGSLEVMEDNRFKEAFLNGNLDELAEGEAERAKAMSVEEFMAAYPVNDPDA